MKNTLRIYGAALVMLLGLSMTLPAQAQMMIAHIGHGGHDGCTIKTGPFPIGFAAYPLPEPGQGTDFVLHPHCDHIPDPGRIRFAIDFQTPQPREMPLALRIVKTDGGSAKEIVSVPAKLYADGVATLETRLEQTGQYEHQLDFAAGGNTPAAQIRIPLHVGGMGGGHGAPWLAIGISLVLVAGGGAGYFFWHRRRKTAQS